MSKSPIETPSGAQLEILQRVSNSPKGLTAAELWAEMNADKAVARTTVITLLQRLELKGWLSKTGEGRGAVYLCLHAPEHATAKIADGFIDRFFGGSASKLVLNLIGNGKLSGEEIDRLKEILAEAEEK